MEHVRELAGERHRPAVTSCYVDVDGRRNPRPVDYERHMANLRRELEQRLEEGDGTLPHDLRVSVRSDLERMERWVSEEFDRAGTRGLALFSCSADGFFEACELPFEVSNEAALGERPRLRQLELGLADVRAWGVVLVDRERLRVFHADPTGLQPLAERSEHIGSRHERGGWAGPGIQRHTDEVARRHFRDFAAVVAETLDGRSLDGILVAGTEPDLAEFRRQLDPAVAGRIAATFAVDTTAPPDEVAAAVAATVEELTERRREELLDRLAAAADGAEPAAIGLQRVVEALAEKRIEVLLVADGYTEPGRRCPACETLTLQNTLCPACDTPTEPVEDLVDEVVTRAVGLDAVIERAAPERLRRYGQIAAILRW